MKVYKSKILGLIYKNSVKARKFKRGTMDRYGSGGVFLRLSAEKQPLCRESKL